uniref:hypothetical protein n=1 Tax=Candidatus Electronema sp. TaxID=2698783 RepID=UPI004056DCFD
CAVCWQPLFLRSLHPESPAFSFRMSPLNFLLELINKISPEDSCIPQNTLRSQDCFATSWHFQLQRTLRLNFVTICFI